MSPIEYSCSACRQKVGWLTVDEVGRASGMTRRTIYNWINRAWVHTRRLPNGRWLVCARSLDSSEHLAYLRRSPGPRRRQL
jgi:hypothetical protein